MSDDVATENGFKQVATSSLGSDASNYEILSSVYIVKRALFLLLNMILKYLRDQKHENNYFHIVATQNRVLNKYSFLSVHLGESIVDP